MAQHCILCVCFFTAILQIMQPDLSAVSAVPNPVTSSKRWILVNGDHLLQKAILHILVNGDHLLQKSYFTHNNEAVDTSMSAIINYHLLCQILSILLALIKLQQPIHQLRKLPQLSTTLLLPLTVCCDYYHHFYNY